jgi:peptidyl-prolyl cis-trans isomerase C
MTLFRSLLLLCPATCLLAQTPPPKPAAPPEPTVKLSVENPPAAPVVPPDKVVLTIGDITITAAQFDAFANVLPEQYRAVARGPARKQFADQIVHIFVLAEDGMRRKLNDTPGYKAQAMFSEANVMASVVNTQIQKDIKVDDAELHKYYDAHKADFEQVNARHILVRVQGAPMPVRPGQKDLTDAEALAKAQELKKRITGGSDFAQLAMSDSDDTSSGAKGGELGAFHHGQMVPAFDEAAFALKAGSVSDPVKTQFGYHLIKVESHETKTFEQARPELEGKLRPEEVKKTVEEMVQKAKVVMDPEFFGPAPSPASAK